MIDWYYAKDNQQVGPFSPSQFDGLVNTGVIQATTMVWHEGLSDWQRYSELQGQRVMEMEPMARCIRCGQSFPDHDVIELGSGDILCSQCKPEYLQRLKEGLSPLSDSGGVWREGKTLVMEKSATMPARCIKCNQPAHSVWTKKLSYNHPAIYLLLLINVLVVIIVAVLTGKKATIDIPICDTHHASIKKAIALSWCLCLGAVALIVCAIGMEQGALGIAGGIALLAGIIVGLTRGRLAYASKIDKETVWMKGVCSEYLDSLSGP